ncbi:MAG: lamin tail domain-containing protein [bacterium]
MKYLLIFLSVLTLATFSYSAMVINEYNHDDVGTDNYEFVELYNSGPSSVDLTGWLLIFGDNNTDNVVSLTSLGTITAGGFAVIGDAAAVAYAPVGTPTITDSIAFQNDMEFVSLATTISTVTVIIDSVVQERNKANIIIPIGHGEPPFDGISATSGGGIWANTQLVESGGVDLGGLDTDGDPNASFSDARHSDGYDTNVNNNDFGMQIASVGRPNNFYGTVNATPSGDTIYYNTFDGTTGTKVADIPGNWYTTEIRDPTVADAIGAGLGAKNPNAIPASPQGGNVAIIWDSSGGGNVGMLNLTAPLADVAVEFYAYLDTTAKVVTSSGLCAEEATLIVVRGTIDPVYNYSKVAGSANGDEGILWRYSVTSTGIGTIECVERKFGSDTQVFGTYTVPATGWYRLFLQTKSSNAVVGIFGGTYGATNGNMCTGTTTITRAGGIGIGYRENCVDNTLCRPPTIDKLLVTKTSAVPVELSRFLVE